MLKIETIQPHPSLQEYIDFYYLIRDDAADFSNVHYSFPHTVNAITIYKNATFNSTLTEAVITHNPINDFTTLIQGKRQLPLKVNISGKTDRICIWFKPLGLNHFIDGPLSNIMGRTTNRFLNWDSDPAYKACLSRCFEESCAEERIDCLEQFLLIKLHGFDKCKMDEAVLLLCDFEKAYSTEEIANRLTLPLRTFNRTFKQVFGVSPVEYRSIARFRKSMNEKLFSSKLKRLTDIGYESNFYDQSYFIKMYKRLSGSVPSDFFNAVETLGNDKLVFQFLGN